MDVYQLSQVLLYMSCPLKSKLQKGTNVPAASDARRIISCALSDTYLKFCHSVAQGRPDKLTARSKYFSRQWDHYKQEFLREGGEEARTHDQLIQAHARVLQMDQLIDPDWDIALVSFPTELVIGEYLVRDKIDLIQVSKNNTSHVRIITLDSSFSKESEKDYAVQLRALFNFSYFFRELRGTPDLNIDCRVLNLQQNYTREIKLSSSDRVHFRKAIKGAIKSIEARAYYPRADHDTCRNCMFKPRCSFASL